MDRRPDRRTCVGAPCLSPLKSARDAAPHLWSLSHLAVRLWLPARTPASLGYGNNSGPSGRRPLGLSGRPAAGTASPSLRPPHRFAQNPLADSADPSDGCDHRSDYRRRRIHDDDAECRRTNHAGRLGCCPGTESRHKAQHNARGGPSCAGPSLIQEGPRYSNTFRTNQRHNQRHLERNAGPV